MDYNQVLQIIDKIEASGFDSIKLNFENIEIELHKTPIANNIQPIVQTNQATSHTINTENPIIESQQADVKSTKVENFDDAMTIKAPIVGVFYSKPAPDKQEFVTIGSKVKKGDVICIIEAMKVLNEIKSDVDGEVIEIFVNNEDVLEFGQPIIRIK